MAVVATGTLADRPFGRTVAAVAQRQFTGDLRVQAGTQRHMIGFRDGAVVAAEGKHPADSAVKTAMSAGLITSSTIPRAARRWICGSSNWITGQPASARSCSSSFRASAMARIRSRTSL